MPITAAGNGRYAKEHKRSIADPEGFWLEQSALIDWDHDPTIALDSSEAPIYRWFPNGTLNISYNALDRHVEAGRGDQIALQFDSAMTGDKKAYTYKELTNQVARFAGMLVEQGVGMGDRVVIYMPMIPEAVIAMLGCARIGAIHSVVFGGFAAKELAVRVDDAKPKVIITASGGLEPNRAIPYLPIVGTTLGLTEHDVETVIVKSRPEIPGTAAEGSSYVAPIDDPTWIDWDEGIANATPEPPVPVPSTHPLYVLYTSGTTGIPKGVVRDTGGYATALAYSMKNVYDIGAGDVMWTASDVGWVVGHSYITYGVLLVGGTTVMYEGKPVGTPDAGAFWRMIEEHKVNALFTAPTALRAIRKVDPQADEVKKYDISSLRSLFVAGERLDPNTYHWAKAHVHPRVVDHWWQTETGWAICANLVGLEEMELRPGSPSVAVPGYQVDIVDDDGELQPALQEGNIVIKLPLPPGTLMTLWRKNKRFKKSYLNTFDGYYLTGDSGYLDHEGYLYVMGRTDDIINVAGHRLSTGSMEQVLSQHHAVAECAVIGVKDEIKGEKPVGFVVLKERAKITEEQLEEELIKMVRDQIGAVAALRDIVVVPGLPKTRSGKILRKTLRQVANGDTLIVPPTIEDTSVLTTIQQVMHSEATA